MLQECSYRKCSVLNVKIGQILASLYMVTWKSFFVLLKHNSKLLKHNSKLEMKATRSCMSDEQFHNSKALFSWLRWFNLLHGNGYLWSLIYVNGYLWSLIYVNVYIWLLIYRVDLILSLYLYVITSRNDTSFLQYSMVKLIDSWNELQYS